ncbi:MAG: integration host factor subunit alpha [Endozoicomonadaceae bacterium]|nr:integration host factor subunit alpha [Endozoicomonadaceae bacterium]
MTAQTKADIVEALNQSKFVNKKESKALVQAFFDTLSDALIQGNNVKLSGFGNFILREKSARPGRNPKTGQEVTISPRRVVTFKAGQKLKKEVTRLAKNNTP